MKIRRSLALRLFLGALLSMVLSACTSVAGLVSTPTAVPTVAPRATAVPHRVEVSVEQQADGTTLVQDVGNSYEFTLSQEWMAIPVSREDVDRVAAASPAPDAEFLSLARKLLDKNMDAFRLVGMDTDSKFAKVGNPTLVLVTAIPDAVSATLPMPELASMIENTVFTGAAGVQRNVLHNANGLDIAVVEGPYDYFSTQGDTLKTSSKVIGFQANSRVILIQFITPVEFGPGVLPGTDQVVDTIQRIKP
jgi:hypothetical protein